MIDRVELVLLHQAHQMRELHGDDPLGLQHKFHCLDEAIEVWNVGQNIVSYEQIRPDAIAHELLRRLFVEEPGQGRNSFLNCDRSNVRRWLNT